MLLVAVNKIVARTDEQHVAGNKQLVARNMLLVARNMLLVRATCCRATCCAGVNAALECNWLIKNVVV